MDSLLKAKYTETLENKDYKVVESDTFLLCKSLRGIVIVALNFILLSSMQPWSLHVGYIFFVPRHALLLIIISKQANEQSLTFKLSNICLH